VARGNPRGTIAFFNRCKHAPHGDAACCEQKIFGGHCPRRRSHRRRELCRRGCTIDIFFAAARDAVGEEPIAAGGRQVLMGD